MDMGLECDPSSMMSAGIVLFHQSSLDQSTIITTG
jgi:hypothetical protein